MPAQRSLPGRRFLFRQRQLPAPHQPVSPRTHQQTAVRRKGQTLHGPAVCRHNTLHCSIRRVPHPDSSFSITTGHQCFVSPQCHHADRLNMLGELLLSPAAGSPHSHRLVIRPRQSPLTAHCRQHTTHRPGMPRHRFCRRGQFPESHGSIETGAGKTLSIRMHGNIADSTIMASNTPRNRCVSNIRQSHFPIRRTCRQPRGI